MILVLAGIALVALSGVWPRSPLLLVGCALGIGGALFALGHPVEAAVTWPPPIGRVSIHIDAIAVMFLLQAFVVGATGSIYGRAYWTRSDGLPLAYGVMVAGLATVFIAGDGLVFLFGWEAMALAAFFAVTAEHEDGVVRKAGFLYLVCTRAATLCIVALFLVIRSHTGSFAIAPMAGAPTSVFVLALLGFGLKAGMMPLHVWLPSAHASAPSHVSALMSGVLIKAGIYGLVRVASICVGAPAWWGGTVLVLGGISAVLGVVFAIGQHDLKRLLAWHSVENIGIILLGLGLALIGRSTGRGDLVVLGLAGSLLHTWNHGLFKALLFLAAGAVIQATGIRRIDQLGGLARSMPWTGTMFLVGAVAICGLPPLNGFVSELFVYLGFLHALRGPWLVGALGAPALAFAGALAALCFAKVYGIGFLGQPRVHAAATEVAVPMRGAMGILAALCAAIGLAPLVVAPVLDGAVAAWTMSARSVSVAALAPLGPITVVGGVLVVGSGALWVHLTSRARRARRALTWDCGYAAPSPRMQYTSSSFADAVVALFAWVLRPERHAPALGHSIAPARASWSSHVPDAILDHALLPAARGVGWAFGKLHWFQRGSLQSSLLYVLVALLLAFLVL